MTKTKNVTPSLDPWKRILIAIDAETHAALKAIAETKDITLLAVCRNALVELVGQQNRNNILGASKGRDRLQMSEMIPQD